MRNLINHAQIECRKMAQSILRKLKDLTLATSFILCFVNLNNAYYEQLQHPSLNNELKYEFKLLGAAEKIRKQDETNFEKVKS